MTSTDYPAAHSMDTIWYGVDEAGNVAAFDTGSEGSLPRQASNLDDLYLEKEIQELAARGEVPLNLKDLYNLPREPLDSLKPQKPYYLRAENLFSSDFWKRFFIPRKSWQMKRCLILFHLNLNIAEQRWKPSLIIKDENGTLAEFKSDSIGPTAAEYDALVKSGMVLRVWPDRALDDKTTGLFQYYCGNSSESENPELPRDHYERYFAPENPIRIDQLPAKLQESVSKARLNLRFETADSVRVAQHFDDLIIYDLDEEEEEAAAE